MDNHPIDNLLKNTMENLKDMIDVNTIVGDAVESKDGSLIIPISKVSFGFVSGGSEFSTCDVDNPDSKFPFGGGSGAGITVRPVAFLVTKGDSVRLLSLDHQNTYDKIVDSIPQMMDYVKGMVTAKDKKENKDTADNQGNKENSTDCGCNEEGDQNISTDAQ
ncbi:GerW family sporulation protein [Clostridium sp. A1-XYC3]|uniref:GerW family sporulation protein n=1 Tax=Clostridium tanneri TaxID=3037988 RepID=A0ABU4JN45_9CLOT|nr:GerW family sporulation protein [Clostridium sp. A1-XYC3]MDW8799562.1 GerW family sporulation protein [Clostridium sp. A1-XYC3]